MPEAGRAAGRRAVLTFGGGVRVRSRAGKGGTRGRCPVAHKKAASACAAGRGVRPLRAVRLPRSGSRRRVLQEGDYCFCTVMERAAGASGCLRGDDDGQHTVLVAGADVFHISIFSQADLAAEGAVDAFLHMADGFLGFRLFRLRRQGRRSFPSSFHLQRSACRHGLRP